MKCNTFITLICTILFMGVNDLPFVREPPYSILLITKRTNKDTISENFHIYGRGGGRGGRGRDSMLK